MTNETHETLDCPVCGTWCPTCVGPDVKHDNCYGPSDIDEYHAEDGRK